ncbi:hypothetical protein SDRG_14685 [Saprolegnia diclina VS20]|uniref:EGF-like domain-containing protein n=1 Tax=Saprolegnia diclina (strain VS20) TaxID=1156394 RepID=T0RD52_SAPDV|nr:hypothetical protein SDRG_14685 [Saprolegnia diclina VS20]EQC27482.1 hypothetical protein SDRG_14685 [Saprolegnia diclina VS20]|eukprot:XP_008619056.1 hypothetical protein SDRG_14685 [Saprolegnia diclina VS20]
MHQVAVCVGVLLGAAALAIDQNDTSLPTKSGIGIWVDPATPDSAHTIQSSRGGTWTLVMSDEFEQEGRNLTAGEDPLWSALDIPDGVNRAWEIYTPHNVYTKNGRLVIRVDEGPTEISYWNSWSAKPSYETKTMYYTGGMVQSWNKFCLQGGYIEISAKLPGALNTESYNPHIAGWYDPTLKKKVKLAANDRIPDIQFYPTWPGLWLMGNLGRALFAASTNRMWPWTYNECDERYRSHQRISACDANPGFGLNPHQGRGAPEIDILEGGGTAISTSIQIAPGMPDEYRRVAPNASIEHGSINCYYNKDCQTPGANMPDAPTSAFAARGHKSWYQGLRYAANNRCLPRQVEVQLYESVAAAKGRIVSNTFDVKTISSGRDVNADLGLIDGVGPLHWGINYKGTCFPVANGYIGGYLCDPDSTSTKCGNPRLGSVKTKQMDPFEYQMDAISANWDITFEHYIQFWKYQLEWVTGDDGYIRWMLDGAVIFEIPSASLTTPPQGGRETNPKKLMIEEPSYIIFNVAVAAAWGARPPNADNGNCRGNPTNVTLNVCNSFPMFMEIDYIRVWQDTATMSVGCDPASHPTKEFIKAHILNYTDAKNPDTPVVGRAPCHSHNDCTIAGDVVTGRCVAQRCECLPNWLGPRCTRYAPKWLVDGDMSHFGPGRNVVIGVVAATFVLLLCTCVLRCRLRQKRLAQEADARRNKRKVPPVIKSNERMVFIDNSRECSFDDDVPVLRDDRHRYYLPN